MIPDLVGLGLDAGLVSVCFLDVTRESLGVLTGSATNRRGKGTSDPLDAVQIARSVLGTKVSELRTPRAEGARNALAAMVRTEDPRRGARHGPQWVVPRR